MEQYPLLHVLQLRQAFGQVERKYRNTEVLEDLICFCQAVVDSFQLLYSGVPGWLLMVWRTATDVLWGGGVKLRSCTALDLLHGLLTSH